MTDLQERLKYIEELVNGSNTPPARDDSSDAAALETDIKTLKWAVSYLARTMRKHLEGES